MEDIDPIFLHKFLVRFWVRFWTKITATMNTIQLHILKPKGLDTISAICRCKSWNQGSLAGTLMTANKHTAKFMLSSVKPKLESHGNSCIQYRFPAGTGSLVAVDVRCARVGRALQISLGYKLQQAFICPTNRTAILSDTSYIELLLPVTRRLSLSLS